MLRGSVEFERAIVSSHRASVRSEAWLGGRRIAADLPLVAGSVSSDSSRFVRRAASLTFQEDLSTTAAALSKTLARPGCEVRIWRGASVGTRTWWLPVHWGLAEDPSYTWGSRQVSLSSPDLSMRVAYDRFPRPRRSSRGLTVAQQIETLMRETLGPRVVFVDESRDGTAVSDVAWDRDRNDGLTKLATAIGCETYFRPDGAWVLRPISSVIGVASHRVRAGVNLADASRDTDWSNVRNHWVVTADRADGAALFAEAFDSDPESPTNVFGPMRRRTGFYSSSLFTTTAQCLLTAKALLARSQGARVSIGWDALSHPGAEAGDRQDVSFDGDTHRLIVDSIDLDLFGATMSGRGRTATNLLEES